ncbi:MAG: GntR family transcriptional regulator [Clostridia bacterium]|nr:GntR family transcriptional regulator [Clostridia bacterium]
MSSNEVNSNKGYGKTSLIIFEELKKQILTSEILPGTQLKQQSIAEKFNVSSIPVREAIKHLEAAGLVDVVQRRGAIVKSMDINEILRMNDIRYNIEPLALSWAIPNLVPEEIDKVRKLNEKNLHEEDSVQRVQRNKEIHLTLLRPAHFEPLIKFIESLYNGMILCAQIQVLLESDKETAFAEHEKIIGYCEKFQVHEACSSLKDHISNARLRLNKVKRKL